MAAIAARDDEIERSLAGFLRAHAEQEEVMDAARARCEAVMDRAGERAGEARARADGYVVRLLELVGDRGEVAARTGLSQRELRRATRDAAARPAGQDALTVRADAGAGGTGQGGTELCTAAAPAAPGDVVTVPATGGGSHDGGAEGPAGDSPAHAGRVDDAMVPASAGSAAWQ